MATAPAGRTLHSKAREHLYLHNDKGAFIRRPYLWLFQITYGRCFSDKCNR